MTRGNLRVVVVEDDALHRSAIGQHLTQHPRVATVTLTADPALLDLEHDWSIDVVVLDLMLGSDPSDLSLRWVRVFRDRGAKVVIYTQASQPLLIAEAINASVAAVVHKSEDPASLMNTVLAVLDAGDDRVLTSPMANAILETRVQLTEREVEILELVRGGATNTEIGEYLHRGGIHKVITTIIEKFRDAGYDLPDKARPALVQLSAEQGIRARRPD